ncbi:hypothetical protein CMI47_02440 [Candidatus Pacearchaeota archaeon]|nr:hypothetical protein [Candidatus Pacearchaeota archaeon]|tara:strand:+ start:6534 stop:7277 length:744 start_codon:yes stop_codon:yes gene_type:complete
MNSEVQFGCYYPVFNNPVATEFVLKNFRKHFPQNPIVLISDGGDDFSSLASKYGCEYAYLDNLFGDGTLERPFAPYDSFRTKEWWRRQKLTCDICNQQYTMILEDDVFVRGDFYFEREFALCGARWGNSFALGLREDIRRESGLVIPRYGMCGGSLYNTRIFNEIYEDVIKDIEENHDALLLKEEYINPGEKISQIGAVDANMTYHFGKRGYQYEVNPWMVEISEGSVYTDGAHPIVHQWGRRGESR